MEQNSARAIADEILAANFPRAVQLAENWLKSLPLPREKENAANPEYDEAMAAYEIARFLQHRQERIATLPAGSERARVFREMLGQLQQKDPQSTVARAAITFCHAQIAENFARDFAGQKSYQLQVSDLLQLAYSLIMIGNYNSAREVLAFILTNHPTQATAHYFAAHVANLTGNDTAFFEHYREALYLKPEVVAEYPEFLPGGVFQEIYALVQKEEYAAGERERIYALLLEVNGVYRHRRKFRTDEIRQLENEYRRLKQEHSNARSHKKAFEPRLLQLLAMLVLHAQQTQNFEKFEQYRSEMIAIDQSIWQTFQQNNFSQNPS